MNSCEQASTNKVDEMCAECRNRNNHKFVWNGSIVAVKVATTEKQQHKQVKRMKERGGNRDQRLISRQNWN